MDLVAFRRHLHQRPEVSGQEVWTAAEIAKALEALRPNLLITGLGGHGVAAAWGSGGPTVLLRAELDALPIAELSGANWASRKAGRGHLCGHDGHMTILMGVAEGLAARTPRQGRVVLLFQPAEEDGSGAAAVLADPRFAEIAPDWAFALHNMPGLPLGHVSIAPGPANCASEGLRVVLTGRTAHASAPETGLSPALTLAALIPELLALGAGGALGPDFRLVSLCHVAMGAPAFGITPGEGEIWLTLRTMGDAGMAALRTEVMGRITARAEAAGLGVAFSHHDGFAACVNHEAAAAHIARAVDGLGMARSTAGLPMRASEDFGRFASVAPSAMFLLGAGEACPALHNPDYDFPDALITPAVAIFEALLAEVL
jgi:amidohydrolase